LGRAGRHLLAGEGADSQRETQQQVNVGCAGFGLGDPLARARDAYSGGCTPGPICPLMGAQRCDVVRGWDPPSLWRCRLGCWLPAGAAARAANP